MGEWVFIPRLQTETFHPFPDRFHPRSPLPFVVGSNHRPSADYRFRKYRSNQKASVVVEWVVKGRIELEVAGDRHFLSPGQAMVTLQPMEARYGGVPSRGSSFIETIWMEMRDPMWLEYLHLRLKGGYAITPVLEGDGRERLTALFQGLKAGRPAQYPALFMACHNLWLDVEKGILSDLRARREVCHDGAFLRELVDAGGSRNFSIATIARNAGYSREHFSRKFHAQQGVSPVRFVARTRVELLKKLLRTTGLSTLDASERAGFGSYRQAARVFFKTTGKTMAAFRKDADE